MPKGLFSQGVAILLSKEVSIHDIAATLEQTFEIIDLKETVDQWEFSGPSLSIAYRTEVNGSIQVDVVDRPWPDNMGGPTDEAMLFGAWTMGFFGPFTYPENLERAAQQAWGYPEGRQAAAEHTAFIRIRSTYLRGQTDDHAPVMPEDYEPLPELLAVTSVAEALLKIPEALCYFNPNGESLASSVIMKELFERYEQTDKRMLPLELWSNVRMFNLPEEWLMMDTVGMLQLDAVDHEAIFYGEAYDPNEVASFLRNMSDYVFENGSVIKSGDTTDGPGGIHWRCVLLEEGLTNPPRDVIRWYPLDDREKPEGLE